MLYAHGNGSQLGSLRARLVELQAAIPVHVLAVEYPGYGLCAGRPCESELNRVIEQGCDFILNELNFPAEQVFATFLFL